MSSAWWAETPGNKEPHLESSHASRLFYRIRFWGSSQSSAVLCLRVSEKKKKLTNKKENGSSARFSVRLVHARGRVKAKTSAPSRFSAYLSGELQTHDEIRLDRCSLTRHFVVLCERIRGRHRVPKRLLIITNIIVGSATAVVTTGNSRRPLPWLSETNALATWAPFPLADKLERLEGAGLQWNVVAAGWWWKVFEGGGRAGGGGDMDIIGPSSLILSLPL